MAEALLGVVTEAVLTKVISLANDQISAVLGVKEDLQSLAKQLKLIQALLSDAQSKSTTKEVIKVWLQELEDAATVADDLLDEFAYQVLCKKMFTKKRDKVRSFLSSSNPIVSRFKMASKIKKINLQMNEIFKNAKGLGLKPADHIINSPTDPREVLLTCRFVDDSEIVGRGDEERRIVSLFTSPTDGKDMSIIGIVGMGGQGKTTLAQLLLKNDEVKKHFEKTVWTCVSDDFNVDRVLKDMLQSLTGEPSQLTNREAIVKSLSTELQGKRFLLVLDDVWNEDPLLWEQMRNSLQAIGGSKESKIIVTTRNEVVVTLMKGFVYHLGVLSREDSQELFEKIAFGDGREPKTPQLEKIGEKIVARCGGVPLALKAIGGLLSYERNEREWRRIAESNTLDGVHSAIKLSFDHLPSLSLKQCFAYCSVFPKDSVIKRNLTIQQWMAHGWLNPTSGSGLEMEDVGNNYFKILLQRSFLQEAEFDAYGNIVCCKMHDLVHDFAISNGRCLTATVGELSDEIKAVHLSIVPDESNDLNISEKNFSRLRTLHLPAYGFSYENFFAHCKCENLRVLTLAEGEMKELPISIAKMKHLRYLDISETSISALPEFISKLYNLQTLRLSLEQNLPKDFGRWVKLRHLDMHERFLSSVSDISQSPLPLLPDVGQLTSLRTLNYFHSSRDGGCQIKELCSLNHLEGNLTISGLENVASEDDAKRANLSGKSNIESLWLLWRPNSTEGSSNDESVLKGLQPHSNLKALMIYRFNGKSLPSWMLQLDNLVEMNLEHLVNCEQIPPLGHLPFLKILRIARMRSVKYVGNDFYGDQTSLVRPVVFPSLEELTFGSMESLKEWSDMVQPSCVSSSSVELFPHLKSLKIEHCSHLTRLPEGLFSAITGLESLRIVGCDNLISVPSLSSLHSLKELKISDCVQFSALPRGIEGCRSLQELTIDCTASVMKSLAHHLAHLTDLWVTLSNDVIEPISNSTDEDDIQGHDDPFSPLKDLALRGYSYENKSLPDQIQRFTALRNLVLFGFGGLETLPEWLGNFHSLERLELWQCKSLANFPSEEAMRGLTNLKSLFIYNCPILTERCKRETGAEWHKIKDIADIWIDRIPQ